MYSLTQRPTRVTGSCRHPAWRAGARARGFTLVELMVTVAVAAILVAIAIPSFKNITLSNRLSTTANEVVTAINAARMEAIKRNAPVQVCSNLASNNTSDTLGSICSNHTAAVYLNDSTLHAPTEIRAEVTDITAPLQLDTDMKAIRFDGQGMGYTPGTTTPVDGTVADICTASLSSDNHRIIAIHTGTVVDTTTTSGACP